MSKPHLLIIIGLFFSALAPLGVNAATRTVVLIPGAGSSGEELWLGPGGGELITGVMDTKLYFGVISEELTKNSIPNFTCPKLKDQDVRTLEERASDCVQSILEASTNRASDEKSFILVGHSMGGLIARLVAQDEKVKTLIHSVVTISTPHQGTPLADFVMEHEHGDLSIYGLLLGIADFNSESRHYLPELRTDRKSEDAQALHAQDLANNPEVNYYSISNSEAEPSIFPLAWTGSLMVDELIKRNLDKTSFGIKNDGIVPEYSMIHGEYLGHIDANHWSSACLGFVKDSPGCKATLEILLPFLQKILN